MIIDCISDLHGHFPKLEGGDLLIVAGDLTARDTEEQLDKFDNWVVHQPYKKKIFIAGNHDNLLIDETPRKYMMGNSKKWIERCEYLCDSGTEFEGLKIWGSPWTAQFPGINPKCCAFTINFGCDNEQWLADYWAQIPDDTDILVTHSPPYGILDKTYRNVCLGSKSLLIRVAEIKPIIHCFGHIHENGGRETRILWKNGSRFINASHVNEHYQPVNKPVRVIL